MISSSIDCIVMADIHIICIIIDGQIGAVRNVGEGFIFRRSHLDSLTVLLGFLISFLCPLTGNDIVCYAVLHEVHGNCCKLLRGTALEEQYLIIIGDSHQVTQILFCGLDDLIKSGTAVAHFHNGHTGTLIIQHFIGCFTQNLLRQYRRACTEIVYSMHCQYPPVEKSIQLILLLSFFPKLFRIFIENCNTVLSIIRFFGEIVKHFTGKS